MTKYILYLFLALSLPIISKGQCISCSSSSAVNNGLIGCFPFDGNANDNINAANNGVATNVTSSSNRFSNPTTCYSTNGTTTSKITIPSTNYQLNSFSYSIWVKFNSLPASGSAMSVICNGTPATANQSIVLINSGGTYTWNGISYHNNTSADNAVSGSSTVNTSTWYFIVFTRDSLTLTSNLYVNNTLVATNSALTTGIAAYGASSEFIVGTRGTAQFLNGQIDDLRIHNRALTASDISSLYSTTTEIVPTNAGTDKIVCSGDSIQLTATGATSYTWTPTASLSDATASDPYAKPAANTKYYVTGTLGDCSATDSVTVTVNTNCCISCTSTSALNTGLVACYPLDANANDMVSSANNGVSTSTTNVANRFGRPNAAMLFNGTSSKIFLPGGNFELDNYTYSVWVNIAGNPASGDAQAILSFGNGGSLGDQNILLANNYSVPSQTGFYAVSYTSPPIYPTPPDGAMTSAMPSTGNWYHIVSTRNTTTGKIKVYVNGVMMNESTLSTTTAGYAAPIQGHIGVRSHAIGQFFNGSIDDIRIYNRSLSDNEIATLYTLGDGSSPLVDAGVNKTLCLGDSVQLTAIEAASYNWSSNVSLSDSTIANPYVRPTATTKYYVTGTTGSCSATDSVQVYVSTNCCVDCKDTVFTLNQNLVACFPFNGNGNDETSYGNNGTVFAGATLSTDRKSASSKAYSFDGTASAYINVAPSASLNTANMNNFSFACWFNPGTSTTTLARRIFNIQDASNRNYDLAYSYQANKLVYINWNGTTGVVNMPTKLTFTPGNWYHVAVTIDSLNNSRVYINGELDTFSTNTIVKPQNPTYSIGRHRTAGWNFIGKIDDIRIYSRALSSNEIKDLMVAGEATVISPFTINGNDTICKDDSIQLNATGARTYVWSPALTLSDSTASNPLAKPVVDTKYIVNGTLGTCKAKDSTLITVHSINLNAGTDSSVCIGDSIRLNATGASSYKWSSQATLSDSTIANPYAKPTTATKYFVTGTAGVCTATDSITININTINLDAGTGGTICKGDSIQLNATGALSYKWSTKATLNDSTIANPYAKPLTTTTYFVTGKSGACIATDTVTIIVKIVNIDAGTGGPICKGDSLQLNATGASSYQWNTQITLTDSTIANPYVKPPATTTYFVTGTLDGCKATDSITINVNTINLDAGTDSTVCIGDSIRLNATGASSYKWSTQNTLSDSTIANPYAKPTIAKKYFVTGTSGVCIATDSITINVNTINLDAGTGGTICKGDSLQLNATGASSYIWSTTTTLSDSSIANPFAKPTATVTFLVTGKLGVCTALDSVTVIVPTVLADAGTDKQICPGDSIMLQASGGGTYKWQYNTALSDTTIANPYAKPLATEKYYITVTNGGCSEIDSVTVTIASSIIVDAGLNRIICLGDSVQLNPSGASNYKWSYNTSLSDSTLSNPFAKPLALTKYFVTGSTGSCSALDSIEINVSTITVDAGTDQAICGGDSVQLQASGGTTYKWKYNTTLSDSTIANPYAKAISNTQYFVTVSDGTCKATDSVWVNIVASIQVDAGADQQLCLGDSIQLQATGATNYTWLTPPGLSNTNTSNPKASPTIPIDYIVKGEIQSCFDYDTVHITVNAIPSVDLGPDITKCDTNPYTFNPAVSGADIYTWTPASTLSNAASLNPFTTTTISRMFKLVATNSITGCKNADSIELNISNPKALFELSDTVGSNPLLVTATNLSTTLPLDFIWYFNDSVPGSYTSSNPTHTFNFAGRYPVKLVVKDSYGCMDSLTQFVTINEDVDVFIPNVITPNGDGLNDFFEVRYNKANTKVLHGTIWNRWGTKIYDFQIPSDDWWNGKSNGVEVTSDVYYYIITIEDVLGNIKKYNGTITVLR